MTESTATVERAYRVRLRLKPAQERRLLRLFGARRYVWNWALRRKDEAWRTDGTKLNAVSLSREFTQLKTAPETAWLTELPRMPFDQTLRDFETAWMNFFAGRAKRPRRKKFGTVRSARFTLDQRRDMVDREAGIVQLDGIGKVRFRVTEAMPGRLRSVTVSRDAAGRWFGSFTADGVPAPPSTAAPVDAIGIDLGLKDTAVIHDGVASRKVAAPKHLAAQQQRLRRYQRSYGRQRDAALRRQGLDPAQRIPKGTRIAVSNRMRRRKAQIGALHAKVGDLRRNHQHQLTAAAAGAAVIAIEDLAVKAMARSMGRKAFRRGVSDAGLGEIRRQLAYKAQWRGRVIIAVDRFYPSSKTCSTCGAIHAGLKLADRHWRCERCGTEHDRDSNAAINIRREGLRLLAAGTGPDERPLRTSVGRTRRSRGTDARGEGACAAGKTSPAGQPTSLNREPAYRAAPPRTTRQRRVGPAQRVEG